MKEQRKKIIVFFLVGIGYYLWVRISGFGIPCLFRRVTGWLCPGCGITTMILDLTQGDMAGAYKANSFLFVTGPWLIIYIFVNHQFQKKGKDMPQIGQIILFVYLIGLVLFGIWRNVVK